MRQRWILNLVLLGIVLILIAVALYEPGLEKPVELPPLTTLEGSKIQQLRIEKIEGPAIEFKKDNQGEWHIIQPLQISANTFRVKTLLDILSKRDYQILESKEVKISELKLDKPNLKIQFDQQLTLSLGEASPMNDGKRYIQLSNQPASVFLLTDDFYYTLNGDVMSFVNLSPLGNQPQLVELRWPNYHLALKEGKWKLLQAPQGMDTRADMINTLIDEWEHLQALSVEKYVKGNNPTQGEILVTVKGQTQPLRFVIESKTPDLVLSRAEKGIQYKIPMRQGDKLLQLPQPPARVPQDATATPSTKK